MDIRIPIVALATACAVAVSAFAGPQAAGDAVPMPRLKPVPPVIRGESVTTTPPAPSGHDAEDETGSPDERAALACLALLEEMGADAAAEQPIETERGCRIPDPVRLNTIRSGSDTIAFNGTPVLNCNFAVTAARWLADVVSPLARHHLGKPVAQVHVGPGYVCRGRNGATTGKLSEHAFGNAIDIVGLTLAGGGRALMIDDPTAKGRQKSFFQAMRTSACGYFTTVLGPGADDAHADHYHVDLGRHGNSGNYRICE